MGIVFSFLFPRQHMDHQYSSSCPSSSSSPSSSPKMPDLPPPSPLSDRAPSPHTDGSPSPAPHQVFQASPPLETLSYNPSAIGLGILSPQPIIGPFAPITRANLSPLQHKSSPSQQRANPFDALASRHANSPSGPPSFHITTTFDDAQPSSSSSSTSNANAGSSGLRISIPAPNSTSSTSTPSPPLFLQSAIDPFPAGPAASFDRPRSLQVDADLAFSPTDIVAPSSDPNFDFIEFDADSGLSALEKIYLFSRSRAGFHRVFIAHALPRYLGSDAVSDAQYPSREQSEQISPGEAIEYVLPLLNGLALDDDEAVKEALAAELVPIIWWFITHCKVVEDDIEPLAAPFPPSPSAAEPVAPHAFPFPAVDHPPPAVVDEAAVSATPTLISVQAFTPILGSLLLSQNGLVGGPARYAVVELLKRVRHADEREKGEGADYIRASTKRLRDPKLSPSLLLTSSRPTAEPEIPEVLDVGLLGHAERRLFEREIVYQVVIGMGRLDIPDDTAPLWTAGDESAATGENSPAITPDPTTAVPTPVAGPSYQHDSYFPPVRTISVSAPVLNSYAATVQPGEFPVEAQVSSVQATTIALSSPPLSTSASAPPAGAFSSPPLLSGSSNSASSPPLASTPSLTSSSSTSSTSSPSSSPSSLSLDTPTMQPPIEPPPQDDSESCPAMRRRERVDWIAIVPQTADEWPPAAAIPALSFAVTLPPSIATEVSNVECGVERHENTSVEDAWPSPTQLGSGSDVQMQDVSGDHVGNGDASRGDDDGDDEGSLSEEAAVGRLSSMSLMAAVTASGAIGHETCDAFVVEVERVGCDPVYWVRREATFAVGALAKVVPDEVISSSLLPLFESLCQDATWHVRHSVLFALPAILSRLNPEKRRALALDVMLPLARDESPTVRSAVLEALGEVMYTFADDPDGPPRALLNLFLGIRDEALTIEHRPPSPRPPRSLASAVSETGSNWSNFSMGVISETDIYDDPARPLVCAFNYPAVALTLGRARWPELRDLYRMLARDPSFKVRRTLAASLGELARIVGPKHAREDLMPVWVASMSAEEGEVRLKAVECAETFLRAIGVPERREVVRNLDLQLRAGRLKGWREREELAKKLEVFLDIAGVEEVVLRRLLMAALEDSIAAVREAAADAIPAFVRSRRTQPHILTGLCADIRALARSDSFRKRTTFVRSQEVVLLSDQGDVVINDDGFWDSLSILVKDPVVDVRIRVARLLGNVSERYRANASIVEKMHAYAQYFAQDTSHEVQAFARSVLNHTVALPLAWPPEATTSVSTFSRPPPPTPS